MALRGFFNKLTCRMCLVVGLSLGLGPAGCGDDGPTGSFLVQHEGQEVTWSAAKIGELPQATVAIGEHVYSGAAFADVVLASGVERDAAIEVEVVGLDGYRQTVSGTRLWEPGVLLAGRDHDKPLIKDGPWRLVISGSPGLSVRNVARISIKSR